MSRADRGRAAVLLFACGWCAGCGSIGEPLPPALSIARPVRNLRVVEYGDRLIVDFSIAPLTTEGLVLKPLGTVDLRMGPTERPFDIGHWAASSRKIPVPAPATGPIHADLPAADWVGQELVVGVRVVNPKGRASEWSNLVSVAVVPPLATPADVLAKAVPQGARLTWRSGEHSFRVFRRGPADQQPALIGNTRTPEYVDAAAQFGTAYEYMVQAVREQAESSISAPVPLTPKDEFPPAPPVGLAAVPGIGSIELVWDRNTEPDLRGYRMYRAAGDGKFERIAEFLDTPAYSDRQVEAGKKYRYAVSALDQAGNESTMSAAVEAAAP